MKDVKDLNKAEQNRIESKALETKFNNLSLEDGDILFVTAPKDDDFDKVFKCLDAAISCWRMHTGKAVILVTLYFNQELTLEKIPEEKMNELGWYRKKENSNE